MLLLMPFSAAVGRGSEPEWRLSFGLHDMTVPEANNSHTYGVNALISGEGVLNFGVHWLGTGEFFVDHDKDELDPDHIPIWWRMHLGADGLISDFGGVWRLAWVAEADTKANTVSCIEREIKAMPALALGCSYGVFDAEFKAGAGYFFMEIDDDVPKERGYDRDDFRRTGFAGTLALNAGIKLGGSWKVLGHVQQWFDDSGWLENQYRVELNYALDRWMSHSALALSVEINEYNLDPYLPADATSSTLPILPWNDDRLVKLSFTRQW